MSEQIHFYLRGYRKRANLTQKELAHLLGFTSSTKISRYETRRRGYSLDCALRLQAVFQLPVNELFADHYTMVELQVINRARELLAKTDCSDCKQSDGCHKHTLLNELVNSKS